MTARQSESFIFCRSLRYGSASQSLTVIFLLHSELSRDLLCDFGFSRATTAVAVLFLLCCPTAIRCLIVAVVVDSVDRVLGCWLLAHIGKKIRKTIRPEPTVTYLDTSAAVRGIMFIIWVKAAV